MKAVLGTLGQTSTAFCGSLWGKRHDKLEVNVRLFLGLRERMMSHAQQITHD